MPTAITGATMICSLGGNREQCFEAFCAGRTGCRPLQKFDSTKYNIQNSYEISDRTGKEIDDRCRATRWLCKAICDVLKEAELTAHSGRVVFLVGTGLRELRSLELWWADGVPITADELSFGNQIRQQTGFVAPAITISNACAASNVALGLAEDLLMLDEADAVVVAGVDSITESMFGLLDRTNLTKPEKVQPFDRDRRGVIMGEGAAAIVLERKSDARGRKVKIHAELKGVGLGCDAYHETAPAKDGIERAMRDAHSRAQISPVDVDLLMAHGTGTVLNDLTEAQAILEVFGDFAGQVPVCGLKSLIGHTSGASGLIGVVTAIECLHYGRIPPTAGFETPMDEAKRLRIVYGTAKEAVLNVAQINAFGFGGVNAVAIIEKVLK